MFLFKSHLHILLDKKKLKIFVDLDTYLNLDKKKFKYIHKSAAQFKYNIYILINSKCIHSYWIII